MNLAQNIKQLRKEKGLSQSDLAEKIGTHLSHITRIETGKYIPSLESTINIAKVLEVPIDYLINSSDRVLAEVKIEDQSFYEKIKLINSLEDYEKQAITTVIDSMLTKRRIMDLINKESTNHPH